MGYYAKNAPFFEKKGVKGGRFTNRPYSSIMLFYLFSSCL